MQWEERRSTGQASRRRSSGAYRHERATQEGTSDSMDIATLIVVGMVIATALVFDFTNGFHDTANAMATSIATGALKPKTAVLAAGALNLVGAFLSTEVAKTISGGHHQRGPSEHRARVHLRRLGGAPSYGTCSRGWWACRPAPRMRCSAAWWAPSSWARAWRA